MKDLSLPAPFVNYLSPRPRVSGIRGFRHRAVCQGGNDRKIPHGGLPEVSLRSRNSRLALRHLRKRGRSNRAPRRRKLARQEVKHASRYFDMYDRSAISRALSALREQLLPFVSSRVISGGGGHLQARSQSKYTHTCDVEACLVSNAGLISDGCPGATDRAD